VTFGDNLEACLRSMPQALWDQPFGVPLSDFGYTRNVEKQLKAHGALRLSNFLINLFEAICEVLWFSKLRMAQFVILLIFRAAMASLAEILLTRVGGGYTSTGSGFSHYLASRNNASAQSFSEAGWRGSSSTLRSTLRCWQTTGATTVCIAREWKSGTQAVLKFKHNKLRRRQITLSSPIHGNTKTLLLNTPSRQLL